MVIRQSSAKQINELLADLAAPDELRREAAVARLTVIGARAVDRLLNTVATSAGARAAALRALEGIGSERALDPALGCMDDVDVAVALAAIGVARRLLQSPRGALALDRLTAAALDPHRDERVRVGALEALSELPPATVAPVWSQLREDSSPLVRRFARSGPSGASPDPLADLEALVTGSLPDDPDVVKLLLAATAATAPLATLHRLIELIRAREGAEPSVRRRLEWMAARGSAHQALATRGSRVALYDLRETLERAKEPLPLAFLAALTAIGDASCIESIASAYAGAKAPGAGGPDWWAQHLRATFRAIARRERLTRRHVIIRRIASRSPGALADLLGRL